MYISRCMSFHDSLSTSSATLDAMYSDAQMIPFFCRVSSSTSYDNNWWLAYIHPYFQSRVQCHMWWTEIQKSSKLSHCFKRHYIDGEQLNALQWSYRHSWQFGVSSVECRSLKQQNKIVVMAPCQQTQCKHLCPASLPNWYDMKISSSLLISIWNNVSNFESQMRQIFKFALYEWSDPQFPDTWYCVASEIQSA